MNNRLVYSSGYDFSVMGLDELHPFDAKKFSKAWRILESAIPELSKYQLKPQSPISNTALETVHTPAYLQSLSEASAIADVIELGLLRFLPSSVLTRSLLDPIRLATAGTLVATVKKWTPCNVQLYAIQIKPAEAF